MNRSGHSHKGSISLEAVLTLPLVLVFIYGMISQITAITARVKLAGAMQRTASEISLLIPAASTLQTIASSQLALSEGLSGEILQESETIVATIGTDAAMDTLLNGCLKEWIATAVVGPLVLARVDFWLDEMASGQTASSTGRCLWRQAIENKRIFLDWQTEQQVLWLVLRWDEKSLLGRQTRTQRAAVALWADLDLATDDAQTQPSVWSLDNFTRGKRIRSIMGADLPDTFPVIARFDQGQATSIKSIDLTAASYQDRQNFQHKVTTHLANLAAFDGADYNRSGSHIQIDAAAIKTRRLLLVIPENSSQTWLDDALQSLSDEAQGMGLILETVRYGISEQPP